MFFPVQGILILETSAIENALKELGRSGCYGNPQDFLAWIRAKGMSDLTAENFTEVFNNLVKAGIFQKSENLILSYRFTATLSFPDYVEYNVSSLYEHFPIQFARTRLESFLSYHRIDPEEIILLLIGGTEAFENAIKYNSGKYYSVRYWLENKIFRMIVENDMTFVTVEENIASGKFDIATTLMRGLLVMNKIFDTMDLNFTQNNKHAVLTVEKNYQNILTY
jgi:anti-sigma regulatory factor (Ser/Thr protein kinase)